ncbi:MAG: hypothetical protein ACJAW4_003280 [Paracoccaceae bacterium]|jgi:hypothetical protein
MNNLWWTGIVKVTFMKKSGIKIMPWIKEVMMTTAVACVFASPAFAVVVDGRYTSSDNYDWVFDVEATTEDGLVTSTSKLYVSSNTDHLYLFYSVPLELKDMTWSPRTGGCCTHDSWTTEQSLKTVVFSEFFSFDVGVDTVGMAQGRTGTGELTLTPFVSGQTTYDWLRLNDVEQTYTGTSTEGKSTDVSSPILTQTAGSDNYEVAAGQQGTDTNDPADYWVFEMGYEFELLRSALPAYNPNVAEGLDSIRGLLGNFQYHLSPYKNGTTGTLLTPCIDTNDCPGVRISTVPLPASMLLLLGSIGALGAWRRFANA